MSFYPLIQCLSPPPYGNGGFSAPAIDWSAGVLYQYSTGFNYIYRTVIQTGVAQQAIAPTDLNADFQPLVPVGLDNNGDLYGVLQTLYLIQFQGSNFNLLATGITELGNNIYPSDFVSIGLGGLEIVPTIGDIGIHQITVVSGANTVVYTYNSPHTDPILNDFSQCLCCAGAPANNAAYAMLSGVVGGPPVCLFAMPNGVLGATAVATYTPTQFDAAWTELLIDGICVDQTDSNLLVAVRGQAGATNTAYLAKLNASTGAILWSTVLPGGIGGTVMRQSLIQHGRFGVLSDGDIVLFNTQTGAKQTLTAGTGGIFGASNQCYNDSLGCIVIQLTFVAGEENGPTPLNGTTSFTGWAALYVDNAAAPVGGAVTFCRIWGSFDL